MIQGTYQVVVGIIARVQCTSHYPHRKMQCIQLSSGSWHNCWGAVHFTQFPQKDAGQLLSAVGKITRVQYTSYSSQRKMQAIQHLSSNYWHNHQGAARLTQAGHKDTGYLPSKFLAVLVPYSAPHTAPIWRCNAFIKQQPMGWVPNSVLTKGQYTCWACRR